jgi:hypothetical protein
MKRYFSRLSEEELEELEDQRALKLRRDSVHDRKTNIE